MIKSYISLRTAWVRGRGHQAEQWSLPGSMGRNACRSSVASAVSIICDQCMFLLERGRKVDG